MERIKVCFWWKSLTCKKESKFSCFVLKTESSQIHIKKVVSLKHKLYLEHQLKSLWPKAKNGNPGARLSALTTILRHIWCPLCLHLHLLLFHGTGGYRYSHCYTILLHGPACSGSAVRWPQRQPQVCRTPAARVWFLVEWWGVQKDFFFLTWTIWTSSLLSRASVLCKQLLVPLISCSEEQNLNYRSGVQARKSFFTTAQTGVLRWGLFIPVCQEGVRKWPSISVSLTVSGSRPSKQRGQFIGFRVKSFQSLSTE